MAGLIPLETFPEDMALTRGLVQRLNDVNDAQGHVPADAAIAATIETVSNLELELLALKRSVATGGLRRL